MNTIVVFSPGNSPYRMELVDSNTGDRYEILKTSSYPLGCTRCPLGVTVRCVSVNGAISMHNWLLPDLIERCTKLQ